MRGGAQVGTLAVRAVAWNPGLAELGRVAAVADAGDDLVVLGDLGAQFFTGGSLTGADRRITTWRGAAAIPAADGSGTWLAALDGTGTLHRVRARASLEPISDRYGLAGKSITTLAALGKDGIAFALAGEDRASPSTGGSALAPAGGLLALADGRSVTMFGVGAGGALAGGGGKVAWLEAAGVRVFEPGRAASVLFPLAGATRVAMDERGRLFASTDHEVYAEDATGTLALVFETASEATAITGLAASGGRVWFAEGAELGIVEGARVAVTTGLDRPGNGWIVPSSSGDVWSLAGGTTMSNAPNSTGASPSGGTLARFAVTAPETAAGRDGPPAGPGGGQSGGTGGDGEPPRRPAPWSDGIAPLFARACASCHGAAPSSGIDLSTSDAWTRRLPLIRRRVLESRDMPPRGHALDDCDREAIDAWTAPGPR